MVDTRSGSSIWSVTQSDSSARSCGATHGPVRGRSVHHDLDCALGLSPHGQARARTQRVQATDVPAHTGFPHVRVGYLAGLLAYASVDLLAQQVRVTHVAGVLVDHSDQHLAQRHQPSTAAMLIQRIVAGDVETGRLGYEPRSEVHLCTPCIPRFRNHPGVGNSTIKIAVAVGVGAEETGPSCPAIITRNVARSPSARCRTIPSSDIVDGSTERRAIAAASRPEHFISNVRR